MLGFESDYMEGACQEILQRLMETNLHQVSGYGTENVAALMQIFFFSQAELRLI